MTKILTDAQYQEQFNADELKGIAKEVFYVGDREEVYHGCDRYVNNRCDRVLELRHGLLLRIWSFEPTQDLIVQVDPDWGEILSLSFFVMGDMHTHLHGVTEQVNEAAGNSYLMYCPGVPETEGWKANQKILRVKIEIEPAKFFKDLSLEQFDFLPKQLKSFATQDPVAPFYFQQKISAEIPSILQQILNCPYQGAMKQWCLEAKALELMTLQFNQIQEPVSNSFTQLHLPEIDRIYQAREILLQNWLDPPSIIDLAKQVGIYHMKLKQEFKEVFGTTPFNYLREYRLEKARELLQDRQLTIVAIANAVGYANPGHFAAAFKRKYGMTPREYRFK
jgi:AraC family transcriptional regulator, transcriptional activator of the genes for pyochelin and ferripyochelin receptors